MSTTALEDDSDPTYTHFSHRDEFFRLHARFLAATEGSSTRISGDKEETAGLEAMGAIVCNLSC
jgi:hypothetical protein